MELNQIANWLNTVVIPNAEGIAVTVAEDLSNIADYGKLLNALTGDEFLDFQKRLAVGISKNIFHNSIYNHRDYGVVKEAIEYGGALQRIMATDFYDADDANLINLVNGTNYFDGTYHGDNLQGKIFETTNAFKFAYSLSDVENQKQRFTSIEGVTGYFAAVENNIRNSIEYYIETYQKRQLLTVFDNKLDNTKEVKLITEYNSEYGTTYPDIATIKAAGVDAIRSFFAFTAGVINRIISGMAEPSKRYNDGTVLTWSPKEKLRAIFLSQFFTDLKTLNFSNIFHPEYQDTGITIKEVDCWQNYGVDALDNYDLSAKIVTSNGTFTAVVGAIYDTDVTGICPTLEKVTSQYIAGGDFTNFNHNYVTKAYTDLRLNAVVFTLA